MFLGFFDAFYQCGEKIEQDKFILRHVSSKIPSRTRHRKALQTKTRRQILNYTVRNRAGDLVPVCSKSFRSITCCSADRIQRIQRNYAQNESSVIKETRGGSRQSLNNIRIAKSITDFIATYRCRESHYGRGKSVRSYLPPELSIAKMWRTWKSKQHEKASLSKFTRVFISRFNLGFGNPRTDVCSFCETTKMEIKSSSTPAAKQKLITDLRVHKLRASKFFDLLRNTQPDTITISFDMQQNQPLPKLSVGEVFYARQVWLYNLTFVRQGAKQDKQNVDIYTWLETQSGRGSNQVASGLLNYLDKIEDECSQNEVSPKIIRLFSDACSSQNKNSVVMSTDEFH